MQAILTVELFLNEGEGFIQLAKVLGKESSPTRFLGKLVQEPLVDTPPAETRLPWKPTE